MAMPDLANPVPLRIEEAGTSPAVAPSAGAESIPNDMVDYITPPPKNVIVVTVRYSEAKKGTPMPYDLKVNF
jgi:hypothetical protein